jgi:uncharacterized protein (DUF983 family)
MAQGKPQNPIYVVAPQSVEACLPKVVCPKCGTLLPIHARRVEFRRRCMTCGTPLRFRQDAGHWNVECDSA